MKVDLYTKAILTVIAAALVSLSFHQFVAVGQAQGGRCGDQGSPCFVFVTNGYGNNNPVRVVQGQ